MNNGSCGSKFGDSGQKVGEPLATGIIHYSLIIIH